MSTIFIKLIIVGDSGTGKTSIITRHIKNEFSDKAATIAPNYYQKIMQINGNRYQINIWDLPGQDMSIVISGQFARYAEGIIYCCDATDSRTRDNLKKWEEALKSKEDIEKMKKILIENKCDLLGDEMNYNDNINELRLFSKELGCCNFFRASAKVGHNIDEAVNYLIKDIIKDLKEEAIKENNKKLNKTKSNSKAGCC